MPALVPSRAERSSTVLAFGHAPDWDALVERVRGVGFDTRTSALEIEREALVVAFGVYLCADEPGRLGALTRTTLRQLATFVALRDERVLRCLDLLAAAGAMRDSEGERLELPSPGRPMWESQIVGRLADDVSRPAPVGLARSAGTSCASAPAGRRGRSRRLVPRSQRHPTPCRARCRRWKRWRP